MTYSIGMNQDNNINDNVQQRKYRNVLSFIIIFFITIIAYFPVFQNEFINWQDPAYITENPVIQELSGKNIGKMFSEFYAGNYQPITLFSLAIDYKVAGLLLPSLYFTMNLLLHIANTMFVFVLCSLFLQLVKTTVKIQLSLHKEQLISLFTAGLFGVHTLHVESVAWASQREDLLYGLFFILSLIFYVKYLIGLQENTKGQKYFIFSLVFFVLSCLSKAMAVSLSVTLFLLDYAASRKILSPKVLLEKAPFIVIALIFGAVAILAQKSNNALNPLDLAYYNQIPLAFYGLSVYILKAILPLNLSAFYPYPLDALGSLPFVYWLFLLIIPVFFFAFRYLIKKENKLLVLGLGFFIVNIFSVLQFIPVGEAIVADRYTYIALIGLFFMLAIVFNKLIEQKKKLKIIVYGFSIIYVFLLLILTHNRTKVWENSLSVWNDILEKNPHTPFALNNRASIKFKAKEYEAAINDLEKVIEIVPQHYQAITRCGLAKERSGNQKEALENYNQALKINSNYVEAYLNRSTLLFKMKKYEKSLEDCNKAIELSPSVKSYTNRGLIKYQMKNVEGALSDMKKATEIDPENPESYFSRGSINLYSQKYVDAEADFTKVIKLDKSRTTAFFNRGIARYQQKKYNEAIEDFSIVIRRHPAPKALYYRGISYQHINEKEKACQDLNRAYQEDIKEAKVAFLNYCN